MCHFSILKRNFQNINTVNVGLYIYSYLKKHKLCENSKSPHTLQTLYSMASIFSLVASVMHTCIQVCLCADTWLLWGKSKLQEVVKF